MKPICVKQSQMPQRKLDINNWWRYICAEHGRMTYGKRPEILKHGSRKNQVPTSEQDAA
jgi:hypothetical protein